MKTHRASLPNSACDEVKEEGHVGFHDDVVLRMAESATLQKDEVSKKRSPETAQLDDEAKWNGNDSSNVSSEINREMEGIDDAKLRAQIEAQLLSATPIIEQGGLTALHRVAESGVGGEGLVARLLAACPELIDATTDWDAPADNPAAGYADRTALHGAARNGHAVIVAQLLTVNPASIEESTEEGFTALHCAARGGHAAIVTQLLAVMPALVDERANDGWTALHSAASAGDAAIVTQLLAVSPALIEAKANAGETALHCAAFYGHASIVAQLLAVNPALAEARAHDGCTALHDAQDGHAAIVTQLRAMNSSGKENFGWTPLHWAAQQGHAEIVTQLLAANPALVDARATNGETAFHCAAWGGHATIMAHLMAVSPASIEARSGSEMAHLEDEAKGNGYDDNGEMEDDKKLFHEIEAQLMSAMPISEGRTALRQAAKSGLRRVVARLLAACPALLDAVEWKDYTPLHNAAREGHTAIVTQLMDVNPALAEARALKNGCTALHIAARYGHAAIVAQLLAVNPALADARTNEGRTVLHWAARGGHAAITRLLLAVKPALLEAREIDGQTALHCAVRGGDAATITRLLASMNPALIEARTSDGRTVLHYSIQDDQPAIVAQLLVAHPALIDAITNDTDALLNVVQIGHEEAVGRLLATHCPNLIQQSSLDCGWTVFHFAAFYGHDKIMSRLLTAVCQSNLEQLLFQGSTQWRDGATQGSTALHLAALKGHINIVTQLLAACPALIDILDDNNQTCLHKVAGTHEPHIAELLLAFKPALAHAVDRYGNTILHLMLGDRGGLMQKVWEMNPTALCAVNRDGYTPFELALVTHNNSAIDLLQWKLTADEILSAYDKRDTLRCLGFKSLMELQCEELIAVLLPDLVGMVFEYTGFASQKGNFLCVPPS